MPRISLDGLSGQYWLSVAVGHSVRFVPQKGLNLALIFSLKLFSISRGSLLDSMAKNECACLLRSCRSSSQASICSAWKSIAREKEIQTIYLIEIFKRPGKNPNATNSSALSPCSANEPVAYAAEFCQLLLSEIPLRQNWCAPHFFRIMLCGFTLYA